MTAEYIEREAAINVALMGDIDKDSPRMDIAARLHDIPAADVRPVVLCKDCIYYYCETCSRWADGTYMKPNDFCSRGAKKEEDNG